MEVTYVGKTTTWCKDCTMRLSATITSLVAVVLLTAATTIATSPERASSSLDKEGAFVLDLGVSTPIGNIGSHKLEDVHSAVRKHNKRQAQTRCRKRPLAAGGLEPNGTTNGSPTASSSGLPGASQISTPSSSNLGGAAAGGVGEKSGDG